MKRHIPGSAIAVFLALLAPCFAEQAENPAIELGAPFADNSIRQRETPVSVWGWSKPGTEVSVKFAGQEKKTYTKSIDRKSPETDPTTPEHKEARSIFYQSIEELITLANGYIQDFGGKAGFTCTIPDKTIAPKITALPEISGSSAALPITGWNLTPELVGRILQSAQSPSSPN